MTQISRDDVLALAQLGSLRLNEEEVEGLVVDLTNILDYVEQLSELDTDGVEPTYQVTGLENVSRDDEVVESSVSRDDLLALAPDSQDNQIKVPRVL